MKIVLIGAGRLSTALGKALKRAGFDILQVYSRCLEKAEMLAAKIDSKAINHLNEISYNADLYIIAISDKGIKKTIEALVRGREECIFVHTAGSVGIDVFNGKSTAYGVFYPLQTFSMNRDLDFTEIPIFLEADSNETYAALNAIAEKISPNHVHSLSSEARKYLHLAAVWACNFTNHCYHVAFNILQREGIPPDVLLPLINETAKKVQSLSPQMAQTGPAIRYDENIIERQKELLAYAPKLQALYQSLTDSIHEMNVFSSKKKQLNEIEQSYKRNSTMINYDLKKIKAIVFDVDGVLSASTVPMDANGDPARTMNIKDGYAIQLAEKLGLKIAIMTGGHNESIRLRYEYLGVKDVYLNCSMKIKTWNTFTEKYELKNEEIIYVGDDIPDYEVMKLAGCACCPKDACADILSIADYVSDQRGGEGVARDVIEQVLRAKNLWLQDSKAFGW